MRGDLAGSLRVLIAALLFLPLSPAGAQRTLGTIGGDLKNGVGDMLHVWSAPARGDSRDWSDASAAAVVVLAVATTDRDVHRWMLEHPSSVVMKGVAPFREGKKVPLNDFGAGQWIQPFAWALYLVGFAADSRALRDAAIGCASAQQAQTAVHSLVLYAVQRERPLTSANDPYEFGWGQGPWRRHAFYGGHAANVMSCASYWSERFHMGAAEPVLYTIALGVGLGRMADQRHWASDTAFGMLFGYAVGTTVGRRARKRAQRESGVAPAVGTGMLDHAYLTGAAGGGVALGWRAAF